MINKINYLFLSIISGFIGAFIFNFAHSHFYGDDIAVIEMDRILKTHIATRKDKEYSEKKMNQMADKFKVALESTIEEVSSEFGVILVVGPAVVSDVPNFTDLIISRVNRRMEDAS